MKLIIDITHFTDYATSSNEDGTFNITILRAHSRPRVHDEKIQQLIKRQPSSKQAPLVHILEIMGSHILAKLLIKHKGDIEAISKETKLTPEKLNRLIEKSGFGDAIAHARTHT